VNKYSKKIKKVGIDIDGILCDFTGEMVRILRNKLNVPLPEGYQPEDWGWVSANLPVDAMDKAWDIIYDTENFWEKLNPNLDNIMTMSEWFGENAEKGCDIFFITARSDTAGRSAKHQSERWLREFLGQPKQAITVLPVKSGLDKAEMVYTLELNFSIDDNTPTICNNKGIKGHSAYLLNRPWNRDSRFYDLKTVDSLKEFLDIVDSK
jgi:hypothetical protein